MFCSFSWVKHRSLTDVCGHPLECHFLQYCPTTISIVCSNISQNRDVAGDCFSPQTAPALVFQKKRSTKLDCMRALPAVRADISFSCQWNLCWKRSRTHNFIHAKTIATVKCLCRETRIEKVIWEIKRFIRVIFKHFSAYGCTTNYLWSIWNSKHPVFSKKENIFKLGRLLISQILCILFNSRCKRENSEQYTISL